MVRRGLHVLLLLFAIGCSPKRVAVTGGPAPESGSVTSPESGDDNPSEDNESEEQESVAPIVIDVRTEAEWNTGHVKSAILIPHGEIVERIGQVTQDKSARIVLYCKSGVRSGLAKAELDELGYANVENAGGYEQIKDQFEEQ